MNNEKIEKIKIDNSILLNNSKEEIKNNGVFFIDSVKRIINEIKNSSNGRINDEVFDSIYSLSEEIEQADSIEKIVEIRKKLNYFITKIKKEKEKRNMILMSYDDFLYETNNYRKSIAKHIRYLKRINNIKEIEMLNSNYDKLSEEDLSKLKKLIKREQNYNNKNLKNPNEIVEKVVKHEDKQEDKIDTSIINNFKINQDNVVKVLEPIKEKDLDDSVSELREQYKMNSLPSYDKNIGSNMITLVKNIPVYLKNKKIISSILEEKEDAFGEKAFNGFIEFNLRRNSIRLALKEILNPKYRNSIENLYLSDDNYCSYWIKKCYSLRLHR